jgi:predicted Zn-dependent protease
VHHEAKIWQDSLKRSSWIVNDDEYLAMIDGIVYGEDPQQGYVEGNTFYHPVLKFKFNIPSGWQLENQPTQVNMAPQDGRALIVFTLSQDKTLEQAAQNTLKQLDLKLQESKNTNINGMPALVTLSKQVAQDQSTGQTQTNVVESTFINFSGTIYVFHGVTTEADFNNFNPVFSSTMTGFSKLTDASKLNVKAKHINIKKIQRTGTLADALKAYGMQQSQMEELSLLNNMELNAQVQAGKLIKVFGQ